MNKSKPLAIGLLVLLCSLLPLVYASETVPVSPHGKSGSGFTLFSGNYVRGTLNVSGGSGNDTGINFIVFDPAGKEVLNYNRVTSINFTFMALLNGTYDFSFDNSFSTREKTVTWGYYVQPPGGISSERISNEAIIALMVIIFLVIVIVLFALAERKREKTILVHL